MSLFCIDIGNTNVVMGLYEGEELVTHWRIATDHHKMAECWNRSRTSMAYSSAK